MEFYLCDLSIFKYLEHKNEKITPPVLLDRGLASIVFFSQNQSFGTSSFNAENKTRFIPPTPDSEG